MRAGAAEPRAIEREARDRERTAEEARAGTDVGAEAMGIFRSDHGRQPRNRDMRIEPLPRERDAGTAGGLEDACAQMREGGFGPHRRVNDARTLAAEEVDPLERQLEGGCDDGVEAKMHVLDPRQLVFSV